MSRYAFAIRHGRIYNWCHCFQVFAIQILGSDARPKSISFFRGDEGHLRQNWTWLIEPLETLMRLGKIRVAALELDFKTSPELLGHYAANSNFAIYYTETGCKQRVAEGPIPLSDPFYGTVGQIRDHLSQVQELSREFNASLGHAHVPAPHANLAFRTSVFICGNCRPCRPVIHVYYGVAQVNALCNMIHVMSSPRRKGHGAFAAVGRVFRQQRSHALGVLHGRERCEELLRQLPHHPKRVLRHVRHALRQAVSVE